MPIKRRTTIRGEKTDPYVYVQPDGLLVVRTPALCTKWRNDFRMRIVRDYIAPRTLRKLVDHQQSIETTHNEKQTYRIMGQTLRITHPTQSIEQPHFTVVLRTDIENLSKGNKLFLNHEDPAMRMLMVYSYLSGEKIGGVPELQIAAIEKE